MERRKGMLQHDTTVFTSNYLVGIFRGVLASCIHGSRVRDPVGVSSFVPIFPQKSFCKPP